MKTLTKVALIIGALTLSVGAYAHWGNMGNGYSMMSSNNPNYQTMQSLKQNPQTMAQWHQNMQNNPELRQQWMQQMRSNGGMAMNGSQMGMKGHSHRGQGSCPMALTSFDSTPTK